MGTGGVRSAGNVRPKCFTPDSMAALAAVARLLVIAKANSGQARRVAEFLLAWHNAEEVRQRFPRKWAIGERGSHHLQVHLHAACSFNNL